MSEKPKGKAKEVYVAFIGDEAKREGRTLRRKAEAQEESEQREKTAQAEKGPDRQRLKGEGVMGGLTGKGGWVVSPITSPAASGRR